MADTNSGDAAPRPTARRPTRDRLVTAASEQFRHGGYHASGIKAILAAAEAPYGSLYHHFPGGKAELGAAAITASGASYGELVDVYFTPEVDPVEATRRFFADAAEVLATLDWTDGCPVATVALETSSESELLRQACHGVFESWVASLADRLDGLGVRPDATRAVAIQVVCLLEGAFILDRAARRGEALAACGEGAAALVASALARRSSPRKITSSI
jgi:AcrR family transcriptional regulator